MRMWSAAVNLFEVVALVAVALFFLVSVVVTALRPAPLLGLFLGRLRPPARLSALASCVALRTEVCATRRHITATTSPTLSLGLGLGLLRRSGFDCSVTLFLPSGRRLGREDKRKTSRQEVRNRLSKNVSIARNWRTALWITA